MKYIHYENKILILEIWTFIRIDFYRGNIYTNNICMKIHAYLSFGTLFDASI